MHTFKRIPLILGGPIPQFNPSFGGGGRAVRRRRVSLRPVPLGRPVGAVSPTIFSGATPSSGLPKGSITTRQKQKTSEVSSFTGSVNTNFPNRLKNFEIAAQERGKINTFTLLAAAVLVLYLGFIK